jgi:hypothetical protein
VHLSSEGRYRPEDRPFPCHAVTLHILIYCLFFRLAHQKLGLAGFLQSCVLQDFRPLRPLLLSHSLGPLNDLTLTRDLGCRTALHLSLALGLQAGGVLGKLFGVGQELGLAGDVLAQNLGDVEAVLSLVVLEHTAESTLSGAEGGVESVCVGLLEGGVGLLLLAVSEGLLVLDRNSKIFQSLT